MHQPLGRVQFQHFFLKRTSGNNSKLNEKTAWLLINNVNMKNSRGGSARRSFVKTFFFSRENFIPSFRTKFRSFYVISSTLKISYFLPAIHNPELRCVFALVLHFLHCRFSSTVLLSTNKNRVMFSCILLLNKFTLVNRRKKVAKWCF